MCDVHDPDETSPPGYGPPANNDYSSGFSRRNMLKVGAAVLAGGALTTSPGRTALAATAQPLQVQGTWRTAMHVHASMSEKTASVQSQVQQAAANGFDILHVTEHDWRVYKYLSRTSYAFTPGELQYGGAWGVQQLADIGRPVAASGGLVSSPVSPHYPASGPRGSLRIALSSPSGGVASRCYGLHNGFFSGPTDTRANSRNSIVGDIWSVDVLPVAAGPGAMGDVYVTLSHHPATSGRAAGIYRLHYRLRTDIFVRAHTAQGVVGVIDVPVTPGSWTTIAMDLVSDAATLWPDLDARDNAMTGTQFWATSRNGASADFCFSDLRRTPNGTYDPVGVQQDVVTRAGAAAPSLVTHAGLEYSFDDRAHINGFGGMRGEFDYASLPNSSTQLLHPDYGSGLAGALVDHIHSSGGLASLNHPFGFSEHDTRTGAAQDTATRSVVQRLLANRAGGADLLEVGYQQRFGYTLDHQLQVFDAMIRNGIWVTGSGTSDDHTGVDWAHQVNNAYTSTWAASSGESDQLGALAAGRAFVGFLGGFNGTLDLRLDSAPMGSITVGSRAQRQLSIDVTGLPTGATVEVIRVDVDYAGQSDPTAGSQVVRRLSAQDLVAGPITVDTSYSCAYRVNVIDSAGTVVAFSQPCWSLQQRPPTPIPASRAAVGTPPG